jgi:hypothetical protein
MTRSVLPGSQQALGPSVWHGECSMSISMRATEIALLVLGVLPGLSGPHVARGEAVVSASTTSSVASTRCAELRETETALAEQELHLLDQLALPSARNWEKDAWKQELADAQVSLEELDKVLEANQCPTL